MYGSNLWASNVYQKYKMKVAFLTAGGIAPCLSASIGRLIYNYSEYESFIKDVDFAYAIKALKNCWDKACR